MAKRLATVSSYEDRLWGNTVQDGDCLLWAGGTWQDGYGKISWHGVHWRVHRLAYTIRHGSIPYGKLIRHTCDKPLCLVDAHHLFGNEAQNMQDKVARNRQSRGAKHSAIMRRVVVRGNAHRWTKLDDNAVELVRRKRLETLRRKIESDPDEPEGCPACGAIAGACSNYPNCPGGQMSYSFSVKGETKDEAKAKVALELAKVVLAQPVHSKDQAQAQAAADAFIDVLLVPIEEGTEVSVSVNGSLWTEGDFVRQASVSVTANAVKAQ